MEQYKIRRCQFFHIVSILYGFILFVFCVERFSIYRFIMNDLHKVDYGINLIPFQSILWGIEKYGGILSWDMLGNILMYVPMGIIVCYYLPKVAYKIKWLLCLSVSVCIETLQFFFKTGTTDIDDILVNSCGALMGILFFISTKAICKTNDQTNDILAMITSILPPFLIIYILDFLFRISQYKITLLQLVFIAVYFAGANQFLLADLSKRQRIYYYAATALFSGYFFFELMPAQYNKFSSILLRIFNF